MVEAMAKYQRYAEYKDSGVQWLGEVPKDWKCLPIKYLCYVNDGNHGEEYPKESDYTIEEFGVPFIRGGNILNFEVTDKDMLYITKEKNSSMRKGRLQVGDVLFVNRGDIGKLALISEKHKGANLNSQIAYLRCEDKKINNKFILYFLASAYVLNLLNSIKMGSVLTQFPIGNILEIKVSMPNSVEQTKIANFLDHETAKIDSLIEKQQQLIQLLKEKRQAVISHAVTKGLDPSVKMKDSGVEWLGEVPEHWMVTRLKYAKSESQNAFVDGPFGSNLKSVHFVESGDVYVIESNFATTGKLDTTELKKITNKHFETISRSEAKGGDIIIAKIGARFGSNAILPNIDKKAVVSGNSLKLEMNNSICEVNYAHMLLKHLKIEGAMDDGVNGSAQPALSLGGLNNLPFLLPPLGEQLKITSHLELTSTKFGNLINRAESAIQLMQERRTALISATVTGKIDVRNWQNPNKNNEKNMELSV